MKQIKTTYAKKITHEKNPHKKVRAKYKASD